ncbi:hypothetical protein HQ531_10285 [bacterium]|nr:hypothetical protein [bacterium]
MRILTLMAIMVVLFSCEMGDDNNCVNDFDLDLSLYYPMEIGNWWIYDYQSDGLIMKRWIIDTLRDEEGQLYYKAGYGLHGLAPDNSIIEYYYRGESELSVYECGDTGSCRDSTWNDNSPIYQTILKSHNCEENTWHPWPEGVENGTKAQLSIIDNLDYRLRIDYLDRDTTFHDVALVTTTTASGENIIEVSLKYYVPDLGLLKTINLSGSDTISQSKLVLVHLN